MTVHRNHRRTNLRAATLAGASLAVLIAAPVLAQEPDGEDAQASQNDDRIVVTGSRIARDPNLTAPVPVQSVNSDDVLLSGDVNIVDVVNDLPALLGSSNTADNAGALGSLGAASLNLRNLGVNRTLTLVDGRRHVAGLAGTSSVDVNTIPSALVERVEVLTGGASAIYGADAVTGVVNFILKDDFDGFDVRAQYGISDDGDAARRFISGAWGRNFDNERGNITASLSYESVDGIRQGDREHTRGDAIASDWANPLFTIQAEDIAQNGLNPLLLGEDLRDLCPDPALGSLCSRIDGIPGRSIQRFPRFNLSSYGSLIGVDFFGFEFLAYYPGTPTTDLFGSAYPGINLGGDGLIFDLNNNGVEDCLETVNGTQLQRFGAFAGCHVMRDPAAGVDVFQDGLLAGTQNAFGGDGTSGGRDLQSLTPDDERVVFNFTTRYDLSPNVSWFLEAKYAWSETVLDQTGVVNGFFDSHVIEWDNPFIPQELRNPIIDFVNDNPGFTSLQDVNILIGRDITDLGRQLDISEREMFRFVTGFEGDVGDTGFSYEVSANYGRTEADSTNVGVILDRYYAAADAVTDPATGEIVCRSDLDPNATPPGSFLRSAGPSRGFLTFTPGDGQCAPMNLFGVGSPSQAAIDFVTGELTRTRTIEQTVISALVTGDSSNWFSLPAGPIGMAFGAEYRDEQSEFTADPLERPQPDPLGIVDASSRVFPVDAPTDNIAGGFDVAEIFGEASIPLLADQILVEELTLDLAYRYSEYSTLGGNESWNVRAAWAPVEDLRFRGTVSQTVRAPNINELFSPLQSATARPTDPCDAGEINNGSQFRAANCAADGIPPGFTDPLTARFSGFTGGNPDLDAETADTITLGLVFEPRFVSGLSITVDWYDIEIADAIDSIPVQQLVNACYDLEAFPNQFCTQFTRDRDPASPTFLGFNSFVSTDLNFASINTQGLDYQIVYTFALGDLLDGLETYGDVTLSAIGNHVDTLERQEDPANPSNINDLLYEGGQPADVLNLEARWVWDRLTLNWQARYWGEFLEITPRLQIENVDNFENAWAGEMWRHDFSGAFELNDQVRIYGGVNNVFEEQPIISDFSYPVGIVGREYFIGVNASF